MANTGAPWNIPYVENADLVKDWPTDSLALANAIASGLDAAGNAGIGSNVVTATKTDTFTSSSTSYTTVTGLSISFTPTSASSKVLVIFTGSFYVYNGSGGSRGGMISIFADGSNLLVPTSPGSRTPAFDRVQHAELGNASMPAKSFSILHSPATTSAVTYDIRVAAQDSGGTSYVNRSFSDSDNLTYARGVSTLTAIEVAA